jgi:predicted P-loop ATPase
MKEIKKQKRSEHHGRQLEAHDDISTSDGQAQATTWRQLILIDDDKYCKTLQIFLRDNQCEIAPNKLLTRNSGVNS